MKKILRQGAHDLGEGERRTIAVRYDPLSLSFALGDILSWFTPKMSSISIDD